MHSHAPPAAKPTKHVFDPFNSSATGHQRADNRLSGSTSWRESRSLKLREQFSSGAGGGIRVSDTVGAGSLDFGLDGRTESGGWEKGAKGLRKGGQQSLWECMKVSKGDVGEDERPTKRVKTEGKYKDSSPVKPTSIVNPFTPFRKADGTIRESSWTSHERSPSDLLEPIDPFPSPEESAATQIEAEVSGSIDPPKPPTPPQIFSGLAFYINGSTAPHSDHKIKHLIAAHGANVSIALGRRTVTHVIIGKPNTNGGCGGGLASTKIQKEIAHLRGSRVQFVTSDWVVDSVKAGKRLPESKYEAMRLAPKGVASINSMFKPKDRRQTTS